MALRRAAFVVLALLAACGAQTPRAATPAARDTLWLYAADPARDAIAGDATEADLVARHGARNVRRDSISLGEGEYVNGTVLFPDDSTRRLEITWEDPEVRARPAMRNVVGFSSIWTVAPGIRMGTSLAELEALNGRPFTMLGFGWDYAGTVSSWEGGRLDSLLRNVRGRPRVIVRLYPRGAPQELIAQVQGDRPFSSSHPALRAMNPQVYALTLAP